MIDAILNYWREKRPELDLYVATSDEKADAAVRGLGGKPLNVLNKSLSMAGLSQVMREHRFAVAVLMGADGMDGSYDPSFSAEQVMALDLAAQCGALSYVTGFSISETFHPEVARIFGEIDPSIRINVRDPLSLQRFEAGSGRSAHQVADVAFLLPPAFTGRVGMLIDKIKAERAQGRRIIGVNFHPLLLELEHRHRFPMLIDAMANVLLELAQSIDASFFLLSHDTRDGAADRLGLEPLYGQLSRELGDRMILPEGQLTAGEIKGLVGELDLVISGRMHLMIASLGAGTPVVGLNYKGKMEGLLEMWGLDTRTLLSAEAIMRDPKASAGKILASISGIEAVRESIGKKHEEIQRMALANFGGGGEF